MHPLKSLHRRCAGGFALCLVCGLLLISAGCDGQLRRAGEPRKGGQAERTPEQQAAWDELAADDSGAYASEADRTEAMDEKAAEMQSIYDGAQAEGQTPEERIRAYQEFEDARQELNDIAEDENQADDAYAPPP